MMNERIKELAEQATSTVTVNHEGYMGKSYTSQEEFFDKEKFAELIVQECSAVANHFSDGHEVREFDNSKRYLYFVDIGKVLLEHFKVEE